MNDADVAASMARTFLVEHAGDLVAARERGDRPLPRQPREGGRAPAAHDRRPVAGRGRDRLPTSARAGRRRPLAALTPSAGDRVASGYAPAVGELGQPVAPGPPGVLRGEDRALADAGVGDPDRDRARSGRRIASTIAAPAGRIRARIGFTQVALGGAAATGSAEDVASASAIRSRVRIRSSAPPGSDLEQVRGGPADRHDLGRGRGPGAGQRSQRPSSSIASTSSAVGGSWRTWRVGQPVRRRAQADGAGAVGRTDDAELRAPAADVDDERLAIDGPALGDPDDRQVGLFLVGQDVERRRRSPRPTSATIARAVGRPADRLGADERDRRRTELRAAVRVADAASPSSSPGPRARGSRARRPRPRGPGTTIRRRSCRGGGPATRRDEEVDRVRAEVDGGADTRARRRRVGRRRLAESVPVVDARRRVAGAVAVLRERLRGVAGRLRVVAARVVVAFVVVAFAVVAGAADDPLAAALAAGFLVVVDVVVEVVVVVLAAAGRPRRVVVGVVVAAVALGAAGAPLRARVVGALAFEPAGLRVVPAARLRVVPAEALRFVAGCALVGDRRRAAGFAVVDAAARGRPRAGPVRTGDTAWAAWAAALPTSRTAPPTAPAAVPAAPRAIPPIRTTRAATSAAAWTGLTLTLRLHLAGRRKSGARGA